MTSKALIALVCSATLLTMTGCWSKADQEVIVYAALDREFSEPILDDFEKETGIKVLDKYDIESTKTVGLVSAIIQEQDRPRCDLFWNNEMLHTLRLKKLGLLDVHLSPQADSYPDNYRSTIGEWYGFAARARVLIVNTELVKEDDRPTSIHDLADPKWKGQVGIAKPLFGSTATHAAVLFTAWGDAKATEYFQAVHENAEVMSGNKQVATAVSHGQLAFGITDTDDAIIEVENGLPVEIIFPDQGDDEIGTLFVPNTLCLIKDSPNAANAKKLVDYLLSPAVEVKLANGPSAQFPLSKEVTVTSRAFPHESLQWMDADFEAAADAWDSASDTLRKIFAVAN